MTESTTAFDFQLVYFARSSSRIGCVPKRTDFPRCQMPFLLLNQQYQSIADITEWVTESTAGRKAMQTGIPVHTYSSCWLQPEDQIWTVPSSPAPALANLEHMQCNKNNLFFYLVNDTIPAAEAMWYSDQFAIKRSWVLILAKQPLCTKFYSTFHAFGIRLSDLMSITNTGEGTLWQRSATLPTTFASSAA